VIGDSLSDIEAARNFGAPSIFIDGDPEFQKAGAEKARVLADASSASLSEAVVRFLS
jgi:phosphoglycolate phosphatase-like HAD superfamily hydrolase